MVSTHGLFFGFVAVEDFVEAPDAYDREDRRLLRHELRDPVSRPECDNNDLC